MSPFKTQTASLLPSRTRLRCRVQVPREQPVPRRVVVYDGHSLAASWMIRPKCRALDKENTALAMTCLHQEVYKTNHYSLERKHPRSCALVSHSQTPVSSPERYSCTRLPIEALLAQCQLPTKPWGQTTRTLVDNPRVQLDGDRRPDDFAQEGRGVLAFRCCGVFHASFWLVGVDQRIWLVLLRYG